MVRVFAQAHLDLLLLAVIRGEPGDGEAVMRELREKSSGRFTPSSQSVYSALHRLERNRLIQRSNVEPRRYVLTTSGRRSLNMKHKEWKSFAKGVQTLLR
jgi:DNA-binding PadR family transcriptional regulator